MPYRRNPHFTGRDELLVLLEKTLQDASPKKYNHRVAIHGMGGVGKTQLAIEYVHRNDAKYDSIFWISAADQAALLSRFQEIACTTGCIDSIDVNLKLGGLAKEVLLWFRKHEGWLLVMDNMDEIDIAIDYLPEIKKGGHTLITTRNPQYWTIPAEGLQIPVFSEEAAIDLLLFRTDANDSSNRSHAAEIVRELGCLALAIEQAAAFIRSSVDRIDQFIPIYRKSRHRFLGRKLPKSHPYPNSLATTFQLSLEKLGALEHGSQAVALLHLLAFLNPDGVLVDFLRLGSDRLDDTLRQVVKDELMFHDHLELLQQYALVELSQKKEYIVIHRLVQAVIKDLLDERELQNFQRNVIELCQCVFPGVHDIHTIPWRINCRRLQNQILEPVVEAAYAHPRTASVVLNRVGAFLNDDGKFRDSERVFRLLVKIDKRFLREGDPETLNDMAWLGEAVLDNGKLHEASDIFLKVFEARKRILGDEHPDTLITMSNLALTLKTQGKLDRAGAMQEKVLEATKRNLGDEHPDTLITMSNYALTLRPQGKLDQAAAMQEKVLEATNRILGDEHPDTLITMSNLALTLKTQGKLDRAGAMQEKVLEATKRNLGDEHPDTLITMSNYALTLHTQGKLDQAAAMQEKVLEARKRILGFEHPDTLRAMAGLAQTFWSQRKLDQAAAIEEKILEARRRILGDKHPATLISMRNLAITLRDIGKLDISTEIQETVLEETKRILGEDHPDTLISMYNRAFSYKADGRLLEAIDLMRQALAGSVNVLGDDHPDTRDCMETLNEWLGTSNFP